MSTEHSYGQYEKLFDEIVENDDLITAETILRHVYPILSLENQDDFTSSITNEVMNSGSNKMQSLFVEVFGLSSSAANSYIFACLRDPGKDRSQLVSASKYIGEYYGANLVGAVVSGDLEVAETLYSQNIGRPLKIRHFDGQTLIDDETIPLRSEVMAQVDATTLKELFRILDLAGLRVLIDSKFRQLGSSSFVKSAGSTSNGPYIGALPTLSNGVIINPELMLAFKFESERSPFGKVYSKVPCWVKPGEFEASESISLFNISHVIEFSKQTLPLSTVCSSYQGDSEPLPILGGGFKLGLEYQAFDTEDEDRIIKGTAENLIKEVLTDDILAGFGHPKGYQLAVVDLSFLSQLGVGVTQATSMMQASEYADNFFPVSVLNNAYVNYSWDVMNDDNVGIDSFNGRELFEGLSNEQLSRYLIDVIPPKLWKTTFNRCSYELKSSEILKAKDLFGLDNRHGKLRLDATRIADLHQAGYVLQNNGDNCSFQAKPDSGESFDRDSYVNYMNMGGWPSDLKKPDGVAEGLGLAMRKKNDPIYKFYLLHIGIDEVIKCASTTAQFNLIYDVFPRQEIEPFLNLVPQALKGRHLEDDLGL